MNQEWVHMGIKKKMIEIIRNKIAEISNTWDKI